MAYEKSIHVLSGGTVMVECGPMRLIIDARVGKVAQPQQAARAAEEAVRFLEGVARARPFLGRDYQGSAAADHRPAGTEDGRQHPGGRR